MPSLACDAKGHCRITPLSGKFIAVKIAPPPISNATVCRMLAPGGMVIECLQWPPRTWLESLTRVPDAAT